MAMVLLLSHVTQWVKTLRNNVEDINNSYGPRMSGKIASQYDEFFFDAEAAARVGDYMERPQFQDLYLVR
jgi:uncharacterized Zn-binding protein involved in type VI secretion